MIGKVDSIFVGLIDDEIKTKAYRTHKQALTAITRAMPMYCNVKEYVSAEAFNDVVEALRISRDTLLSVRQTSDEGSEKWIWCDETLLSLEQTLVRWGIK